MNKQLHRGELIVDFVDQVALLDIYQQLIGTPAVRVERSEGQKRSTGVKVTLPIEAAPGLEHQRERQQAQLEVYERSPVVHADLLVNVLDGLVEKRLVSDFVSGISPVERFASEILDSHPADEGGRLYLTFPHDDDEPFDESDSNARKERDGPGIWGHRSRAAARERRWILIEGSWAVEESLRLKDAAGAGVPEWVRLIADWPGAEPEATGFTQQGQRLRAQGATVSAGVLGRAESWDGDLGELRVLVLAAFDRVGGDSSYVWGDDESSAQD